MDTENRQDENDCEDRAKISIVYENISLAMLFEIKRVFPTKAKNSLIGLRD